MWNALQRLRRALRRPSLPRPGDAPPHGEWMDPEQWLRGGAELDPDQIAADLVSIPPFRRIEVMETVARQARRWSPRLVHVVAEARPHLALWIAENPHFQDPASIQSLLDWCAEAAERLTRDWGASSLRPEHLYQVVEQLAPRGQVPRSDPTLRQAWKQLRENPHLSGSRRAALAHPETPTRLLRSAYRNLLSRELVGWEAVVEVLEVLLGREEIPDLRETWKKVADAAPRAAARLLGQERVRQQLLPEDLLGLLASPDPEMRLAALRAVSPSPLPVISAPRARSRPRR